ncbi:unnamed protein product [Ilex paraguariensis]|uniref:Uncharacterized protein n=1 Tax=Ilex paraguariensis TaxID=185542 RepID=A0ABC8R2P1_9AQUA
METKGGRELANFALHRATQTFLKNVPAINLFNARFKEQIKDVHNARAAFLRCDTEFNSNFIQNVIKEANMEKRLGNLEAASNVYEKALEMAAERKKLHAVPNLYIYFSRLKYMITGSVDAARDVIIDGIQHVPLCRLLLEELIKFAMMHEGSRQVNTVDYIIASAISPGPDASQGLSTKDREEISCLYLEFVDLCGTIHDVNKAWHRHMKLFPHLTRTAPAYESPTTGSQLLNMTMEGRHSNPFALLLEDRGHGSAHGAQLALQEQERILPKNQTIQPDQVLTDQTQPEDHNNSAQERKQQSPRKVATQFRDDESGVNELIHDSGHKSGDDASRPIDSSPDFVNHPREGIYGSVESSQDLVLQSGEDAPGPYESIYEAEQPSGPTAPLEGSQVYSDLINIQQERDHEFGQHLNQCLSKSISSNFQWKETQELLTMASREEDVPQEISTSNGRILEDCQNAKGDLSMACPNSIPAADYAQFENKSDGNELVGPSSSASHQDPTTTRLHSQLEGTSHSSESWHQTYNMVTASVSASSEFHERPQDQQGQQQQDSPKQQHPSAETCATSQGKCYSGEFTICSCLGTA